MPESKLNLALGILVAILAVCLIGNEIAYRVQRWLERRRLNRSEIINIRKRRGQLR